MGLPILVSNPPHRYRRRRRRKAKARRRVIVRRNPPKKARRRRRRRSAVVFVSRKAPMRRRRRSRGSRRRRGSRALGHSARGFVSNDLLKTGALTAVGIWGSSLIASKIKLDKMKPENQPLARAAIVGVAALIGGYALRRAGMRPIGNAFTIGGLAAAGMQLWSIAAPKLTGGMSGLDNMGYVDGINSYPAFAGVSEMQALAGLGCMDDLTPVEAIQEV